MKAGAMTAAGLSLAPPLIHSFPADPLQKPKAAHGLLFDPADLPRIRSTVRLPRFAPFWQSLRDADLAADRKFLSEELRLNNHVRDMLRARQILERTAFVYALTEDRPQREVAGLAIERLLQYKRWDYFLEGGEETIGLQRAPEATIAMVCALEWLGSALPADLRTEMEHQIAEKGAPACYRTLYGMKYPERVRGWGFDPESDYAYRFDLRRWPLILNSTNLKVIPIAGLMLAGCLLQNKHPQASRWVDLALQSATAFSTMYGPDGSYDEGVGYWGYTTLHLALALDVCYRALGQDHRRLINFPGTVRYALAMAMPTGGRPQDCVNFGDAWNMGDISVAAWTAHLHNDPVAQYVATHIGLIQSPFAILWYDPAIPVKPPPKKLHTVRLANDLVITRTGWDERSTVVALRSGGPANHEHADRNSVVFAAYGERLFHDPFKAAYSYTDPLWLLRLTKAHTAVLINGKGHQYHDGHEGTNASWAEARIVSYRPGTASLVATSDATDAYRLVDPAVAYVARTLVVLKPDVLVLVDTIRLHDPPLPVQLRFQVDNSDGGGSAAMEGTTFRILRPGATLAASVHGGTDLRLRTGTLPLSPDHGSHPFVEVESGPSVEHSIVTVCTAQERGREHGTLTVERTGTLLTIRGRHNAQMVDLRLDLHNDIPGVTL